MEAERYEKTKSQLAQIGVLLAEIELPPVTQRFAMTAIEAGVIRPEESEAHWQKLEDYFNRDK